MPSKTTSRSVLLLAASTMTVLLAACSPGALAPLPSAEAPTAPVMSETPAPTATPAPTQLPAATSTPAATPEPSREPAVVGPQIPAGWVKYDVDGWASVYAPAGWSVEPITDHPDEPAFNLVDASGEDQLNFMYEVPSRGPVTPEYCDGPAFQPSPFTLLKATPLPWALDGEELHYALTIREVQVYNDQQEGEETISHFQVAARLAEADRYVGTDCEPFSAIYPDSGGYLWVSQHGDPIESLFFSTEEEAVAYTESEESKLVGQVLQTVELTL